MKVLFAILTLFFSCAVIAQTPANAVFTFASNHGSVISVNNALLPASAKSAGELDGDDILKEVSFGVLLGTFKFRIPIESDFCKKIRADLSINETENGFVYSVGSFASYNEAENYRQYLTSEGYENTDVVSFYKNQPIMSPVTSVKELMSKK